MLTQDYIKSVFHYNNGHLFWLGKRKGAPKNKPVGSLAHGGYLHCMLDGKHYLIHRLVFLYFNGYLPENVDHINGNRADNRIENLRAVTKKGNQQNMRKAFSTSKSGLLGAFLSGKTNKWFSCICTAGKRVHLGTFNSPEEAHEAYIKAKRELHKTCTI